MSLKSPTALEYLVIGIVNAVVAAVLAMRQSWTAAYFGVLALGSFWCAIRAKSSRKTAP